MILKIKCDLQSGEAMMTSATLNDLETLIQTNPLLAADVLKDALYWLHLFYQDAHDLAFPKPPGAMVQ
jgi:hypothetical protein